jgi:hypothetical protein
MAGEGHERRSKQCQEAGGSSSSRGPSSHPKKLVKRPRSNSLREESSPEDSPPCGGTLDSPKEVECLKIRVLDCHINGEEVDYNKEDPSNIITLQDMSCYYHGKERGTDERFWTFLHQGWYHSVLYRKTSPVVKHQQVHIDYMRNKKDIHFNKILEACNFHGITDLHSSAITGTKRSSQSSTPLSSLTRKI